MYDDASPAQNCTRNPGGNVIKPEIADAGWRQVLELAHEAVELPEADRERFMAEQGVEPEVACRVLEMVREFEPVPEFGPGSRIGRFTATEEVARGGSGQIFAAIDDQLGRTVALKVLDPESVDSDGALDLLLQEARAAAALCHPNIVTVYEVIRSGHTVALAMEYVPGCAIRTVMRETLQLEDCLPVWQQVSQALAASHASGVAHRDIKPENIMVRPDGLVKVLDFGMAHRMPEAGNPHDPMWELGTGTPHYMSPEQCHSKPAGIESDVFSLGVVFYEMLAGRHPFACDSALDTMIAIAEETPDPPSRWNPAVRKEVDRLILSMLRKDPADRPTAGAVVQAIEELAGGGEGLVERAAGWASRTLRAVSELLWPVRHHASPQLQ
jgi:eukaryotic-like serine/threonine-protein kinase